MIDRLIEALQDAGLVLSDQELAILGDAQSLLHDEDIADALWLAARMGGSPEPTAPEGSGELTDDNQQTITIEEGEEPKEPANLPLAPVVSAYVQESRQNLEADEIEAPESGLPLQVQTAPALPNALGIGRSLRPLMRKASSRTQLVLDEMATVDRIAQEDIWIPVLKPASERWFDLELVVEASPFEFVWEATLTEFQRLLEQQGAFRNVRTWSVETTDNHDPRLFPKAKTRTPVPASDELTIMARSEKELIDASGRAIVLYVSDCRSGLWQSGKIHDWLKLWGQHQPTAVVQLLPERLWSETQLNDGFKVQVSAFEPGVANPKLQMHNPPARRGPSVEDSLLLPVVTLTASALQQWAKVIAAGGQQRLPARLFDMSWVQDTAPQDDAAWAVINPQTPEARLELFNATASSSAKRLARLMSVVPTDLPVVHLLQNTFFREAAEPVHAAEVYNSCLMEQTGPGGTGEVPRYKFVDGVRPLLNNANPIDETLDVLDVLSKEIARTLGFEINSFTALLYPRTDLGEKERAAILPFAQIATQTLHRLGGQYAELARWVEADVDQQENWVVPEEPEELPEPSFPELVPLEVIVAELVEAEDEPDGANESGLELITDEFTIATVTVEVEPGQEDPDDRLEQFEFVVAPLERRQKEWVIQRQRQTGYRFVESLSVGTGPGFFRGVAKRLGLGGNDPGVLGFELEMVAIPGGTFTMGSPPDEPERYDGEGPQHEVTVQPFFMGRYPITQAQWRFVAGLEQINRELKPDPSRFKGDDRPVEKVSWYEVVEFCDRLSNHTGKDYRLPTEAEWEYACRAGTTMPFHFGETISTELANCGGTPYNGGPQGQSRGETTPVEQFEVANAFGLSDMHGNVYEWCQDYSHSNYEGAPTDGSAWIEGGDPKYRVRRGGSWCINPRFCRSAFRGDLEPGGGDYDGGFRVVCSAPRALQRLTG